MTLQEMQAVSDIADVLYDFLPAKPHPYADPMISFPGCASRVGVSNFWQAGSKRPAVTQLLRTTLEMRRDKFCPLILEIVKMALIYRKGKGNPIFREEIEALNQKILGVSFKMPELYEIKFLDGLPRQKQNGQSTPLQSAADLTALKDEYMELSKLLPQKRGYAFQNFLGNLFASCNLAPRSAFRMTGEEIDGSFELEGHTYLLEAKWHAAPSSQSDLLTFQGKVEGKATWSRGVFVSYMGFSKEGLEAFSHGRRTSIIGFDGADIFHIVDGRLSLPEAIKRKLRRGAEMNQFFVSLYELF